MAYVDAQFQVAPQVEVVGEPSTGVSLGTVTASATQTYTGTAGSQANGTFRFPVFVNPTKVTGIRVYCTGAAGAGVSGITLGFLNGTSTLGTTTAPAAGTYADVTLNALSTDSHGLETGAVLFTSSNGEITMLNNAIGTASGSALGSYAIDLKFRNLFVS